MAKNNSPKATATSPFPPEGRDQMRKRPGVIFGSDGLEGLRARRV